MRPKGRPELSFLFLRSPDHVSYHLTKHEINGLQPVGVLVSRVPVSR